MRISDWSSDVCSSDLPFLFVPINAIAYVGLAQTKTAQASSLLNVFRNLGGTFGISVSQTLLAGYQQVHQSYLVERLNPLDPNYTQWLGNAQGVFGDAMTPLAVLYQQVQRQETMLAFLAVRSEERREGKEWGSKCRTRW